MINCWPKVVAELPLKTNNASKTVLSKNAGLHFPTVNTVRVGRKQGREERKRQKSKTN